jgi:hypothetical protein
MWSTFVFATTANVGSSFSKVQSDGTYKTVAIAQDSYSPLLDTTKQATCTAKLEVLIAGQTTEQIVDTKRFYVNP